MAHEEKCQDTVDILTEWIETLTAFRATNTYDASMMASQSWSSVGSFAGDWQPVSGHTMREEAGLSVKSDAIIIAPCGTEVDEGDRIYRPDGTCMYVNYVRRYEDHLTIYLTRQEGSQ